MTRSVIGDAQLKLEQFQELFLRWNERINLSAAKTLLDVNEHVRDCLNVVPHLQGMSRVLDVGSGGGFPVVITAICLPDVQFIAIEPTHKKHAFLRAAARELGLANLESHAVRIEDHEVRDYDAATSRATFDLVEWFRFGLGHVRVGGSVIGFEGVPRTDLPQPFERHAYELDGKQRALIIVKRAS